MRSTDESFAFVKTRARRRARRVRGRGRRPALARPSRARACRVPEVLGVGATTRARARLGRRGRARGEPAAFGAGLAGVHAAGAAGLRRPRTSCGSGSLRRSPERAARRLAELLRRAAAAAAAARTRGLDALRQPGRRASAAPRIARRSPDRPSRPPACTATCGAATCCWGRDGQAWLIDPAAYGGHREVDLAMLRLFGAPGEHFLAPTRSASRSRPATRSASSSTSCSRCSCTPRCSAAAIRACAERVGAQVRPRRRSNTT